MAVFTPEQEARIAEIVGMVMRGINAATPTITAELPRRSGAPRCQLPEDLIVQRYALGEAATHLAVEYGVSSETIYRIARAAGIKPGGKRPRGPRPKHSEKYAAIAEAYEAGRSLIECGQQFGVSEPVIRNALKAFNVTVRPKGGGPRRSRTESDDRVPQIMDMRAQGATLEEIGAALGVTRERVRQIVIKAGVQDQFKHRPASLREREVMQQYADGAGLVYVSNLLGISTSRMRSLLMRHGVPLRPAQKFSKRLPETISNAERAAALYHQGYKAKEIASQLGLPHATQVYRLLALAGTRPDRNAGAGRVGGK